MRMVGSDEQPQLFQHVTPKFILWQHSANRFAKQLIRTRLPSFDRRASPKATGIAGVSIVILLGHLGGQIGYPIVLHRIAGEANPFAIQDDYTVASIDMCGVGSLMLTHQDCGNLSGKPPHDVPVRVDQEPVAGLNFFLLRHPCFANRQHGTVILRAAEPGSSDQVFKNKRQVPATAENAAC